MNIIISCSLNPNSNSHQMAKHAQAIATAPCQFIDLKDVTLPLCSGVGPKPEAVQELIEKISQAQSIILAGPVYNYDLNAAAKNLIEWTGKAWSNKVVGFILAAGGKNSYLAPLSFMNSLMIDFRCIIVPRYVYADRSRFNEGQIDAGVVTRIEELVQYTHALGNRLHDFKP